MIADPRTLEEIRHEGIEALCERLGPAGMIRFLQQFGIGHGDYTSERRAWIKDLSSDEIRRSIEAGRHGP